MLKVFQKHRSTLYIFNYILKDLKDIVQYVGSFSALNHVLMILTKQFLSEFLFQCFLSSFLATVERSVA